VLSNRNRRSSRARRCADREAGTVGHTAGRLPLLLLAVLALVLAVTACGDDPWSGTWKSTEVYQMRPSEGASYLARNTLRIERKGDSWTVTDALGNRHEAKEVEGRLVRAGDAEAAVLELRDDELVLIGTDGSVDMRYERQE